MPPAPGPVTPPAGTPRVSPAVPPADTCANFVRKSPESRPSSVSASSPVFTRAAAMIAAASSPSTSSAFRPVATPVAFVVNGFFVSPPVPAVMRPATSPPDALNSNAKPFARLFERRHGFCGVGVAAEPPAPERQP